MSSTYKVSYFDVTALGEPVRYLVSYGDPNFEDNRIDPNDWLKMKPNTPFGQMPLLEFDGKVAHQSMAICRYLGKKINLVGKTDEENLDVDAAADTVDDIRSRVATYYYDTSGQHREAAKVTLLKETLPFFLERLDQQTKKNGGYLAVPYLTWADLRFVATLEYVNFMLEKDVIEHYGSLKSLRERVQALPNIKKWLEKRPKRNPLTPTYFLPK